MLIFLCLSLLDPSSSPHTTSEPTLETCLLPARYDILLIDAILLALHNCHILTLGAPSAYVNSWFHWMGERYHLTQKLSVSKNKNIRQRDDHKAYIICYANTYQTRRRMSKLYSEDKDDNVWHQPTYDDDNVQTLRGRPPIWKEFISQLITKQPMLYLQVWYSVSVSYTVISLSSLKSMPTNINTPFLSYIRITQMTRALHWRL